MPAVSAALASALSAATLLQTTLTSADPMLGPDPAAPVAAPGLWAAATPACAAGLAAADLDPELRRWPDCARPIRIERDAVGLVSPAPEGAGPPVRRLSTTFALAPAWPGAPAIVQLEVPGLLDTSFAYLALATRSADAQGRFTAARVWPVRCPGSGVAGVGAEPNGCQAATPSGVHEAARLAPAEPAIELRWVAP